jgi:hypothetical protein
MKPLHSLYVRALTHHFAVPRGTDQVFIITKCPIATRVHASNPPSGGGPGSLQLLFVLIHVTTLAASRKLLLVLIRDISVSTPCGSSILFE